MKEKDLLEKVLEEYNDVYADILNGFLFKGEPVVSPEDLEDARPFTLYRDGESVREQYRDMAKFWRYPEEKKKHSVSDIIPLFLSRKI